MLRNIRDQLSIGKETAPFNMAMATTFRLNNLIVTSQDAYLEDNIILWKKCLDMLYPEAKISNTRIGKDKVTPFVDELVQIRKEVDKEMGKYLSLSDESMEHYRDGNLRGMLFRYHELIYEILNAKGLLVATIEDTTQAHREID